MHDPEAVSPFQNLDPAAWSIVPPGLGHQFALEQGPVRIEATFESWIDGTHHAMLVVTLPGGLKSPTSGLGQELLPMSGSLKILFPRQDIPVRPSTENERRCLILDSINEQCGPLAQRRLNLMRALLMELCQTDGYGSAEYGYAPRDRWMGMSFTLLLTRGKETRTHLYPQSYVLAQWMSRMAPIEQGTLGVLSRIVIPKLPPGTGHEVLERLQWQRDVLAQGGELGISVPACLDDLRDVATRLWAGPSAA